VGIGKNVAYSKHNLLKTLNKYKTSCKIWREKGFVSGLKTTGGGIHGESEIYQRYFLG